jgi:hypothetical protein
MREKTRSDPVTTPEAIAGADCPDCGAEKGSPCVFMVRPEVPYPPGTEPQPWMTQTAQDYLRQVGTTTRVAHNGRRAVIRNRRPVRPRPTGPSVPLWEVAARTEKAIELRRTVEAVAEFDRQERLELRDWLQTHGDMFRTDLPLPVFHPEFIEAEARQARVAEAAVNGWITKSELYEEWAWTKTLLRRAAR